MSDLIGLFILAILSGLIYLTLNKKPKRSIKKIETTSEVEKIKRKIDAEYNHFNNIPSDDWKEIDNTIHMLNCKKNELSVQIRREKP